MSEKILIVSPHPDDAVFSLGGFMLKEIKKNIVVWDIFSEQEYSICPGKDSNREEILVEEHQVMDLLKRKVIMAGLPEAGVRGSSRLSDILNQSLSDKEKPMTVLVKQKFTEIMKMLQPETIYLPLGCGKHIDHVIVREAVIECLRYYTKDINVFMYEEFPYALNRQWVEDALKDCELYKLEYCGIDVTGMENKKAEIMQIYKSQIRKREIRNIIGHACNIESGKMIERVWKFRE